MKKLFVSMFAICAVATVAHAQDPKMENEHKQVKETKMEKHPKMLNDPKMVNEQGKETKFEKHPAMLNDPKMEKMTKQEQAAKKESREQKWADAFKSAGLNEGEIAKAKSIRDENAASKKALKADTKLSEDEKKIKKDELSKDLNSKLKAALGEAKYKALKHGLKSENQEEKGGKMEKEGKD